MIRGILFDCGNTPVRVRDGGAVLKEILAELGSNVAYCDSALDCITGTHPLSS